MEGFGHSIVKVTRCSETFHMICFDPRSCELYLGATAYNELRDICMQVESCSNGAAICMCNHLDVGILAVTSTAVPGSEFMAHRVVRSLEILIINYYNRGLAHYYESPRQ